MQEEILDQFVRVLLSRHYTLENWDCLYQIGRRYTYRLKQWNTFFYSSPFLSTTIIEIYDSLGRAIITCSYDPIIQSYEIISIAKISEQKLKDFKQELFLFILANK